MIYPLLSNNLSLSYPLLMPMQCVVRHKRNALDPNKKERIGMSPARARPGKKEKMEMSPTYGGDRECLLSLCPHYPQILPTLVLDPCNRGFFFPSPFPASSSVPIGSLNLTIIYFLLITTTAANDHVTKIIEKNNNNNQNSKIWITHHSSQKTRTTRPRKKKKKKKKNRSLKRGHAQIWK